MTIRSVVRWLIAAALIPVLVACASAPETGCSQILLVDRADEARLGFKTFDQLKRKKASSFGAASPPIPTQGGFIVFPAAPRPL